jgi:hypothetical protein
MILLTSASRVASITGMSHWCLAPLAFKNEPCRWWGCGNNRWRKETF